MKAKLLQIHWHEKQPIYSIAFDKDGRLATAGGDNNIRIWRMNPVDIDDTGTFSVTYVSTLRRHQKAVNSTPHSIPLETVALNVIVGGTLFIWSLSQGQEPAPQTLVEEEQERDTEELESWIPTASYRISDREDIYDIQTSPDGEFIILGLTDNTAVIFEIALGKVIKAIKDHHHFVQGVTWDPLNRLLATQSSDRTVKVHEFKRNKNGQFITRLLQSIHRYPSMIDEKDDQRIMYRKLFHDESLMSFFRRLSFTIDGSLLICPAGLWTVSTERLFCAYVYTRASLTSKEMACPIYAYGPYEKPVIVIKPNPHLYEKTEPGQLDLPYKMVFALATQDAVYVYDTVKPNPIVCARDLHYGSITDLAWTCDGRTLMISSTDGFCSMIYFEQDKFGSYYAKMNEDLTEAMEMVEEGIRTTQLTTQDLPGLVEVPPAL